MTELMLIIISYTALLLLLMPPTMLGVVLIFVMFAVGLPVAKYIKSRLKNIPKPELSLILIAAVVAAYLGNAFYQRWILSSKLLSVADKLHMQSKILVLICASVLSFLSVYFICVTLKTVIDKLFGDKAPLQSFAGHLITCVITSVITVALAQIMIEVDIFSMGFPKFAWGVLIVFVTVLFVYCLSGRTDISVLIGSGIYMLISAANVYVYGFRGRLLEPVDIFSVGTAMNVADNYSLFPIPRGVLIGFGIFVVMLAFVWYMYHGAKSKPALKKRLILLLVCIVGCTSVFVYTSQLKTYHWNKEAADFNGYILDFVAKFKEVSASEPDNYDIELIENLAKQYGEQSSEQENENRTNPHIIVIMDEAFSDLSVIGNFSTNEEIMPFISSLKENTVSGYALSSVYGGNTANSEYEFLTGNSMAWLSPNCVPYQQYIRSSTYSMVSYLKSMYGYNCISMHPYKSSGWNRPAAYGYFGFDECYFIDDFPKTDYIRKYISDRDMFEFLIETYEAQAADEPLFIFGVTMQNHGGYTYNGENYTKSISLSDCVSEYPEVEQYLSLIRETDKAVEYLISYFQNADEDVVIVFFGDHQPKINEEFYDEIRETTEYTLDEQQNLYKVPFFIWANYDIEEAYIDCTSLNYLSTYVYDAAEIELPVYNRFLCDMQNYIPSINANGFYSIDSECYLPFDEADDDELYYLELYEILQYNNIFDKKNQNEIFFPMLE